MKICKNALFVVWLLAAMPMAARAQTTPGVTPNAPDAPCGSPGTTTTSDGWPCELDGLPDTEKRHRLDALLEAHPEDLAARLLRLRVEYRLGDSGAVLSDTEVVLANPSLDGPSRLQALERRSDMLSVVGRDAEAVSVANQVLAIDDADPVALFARGWARYNLDPLHTDDALADLDRAVELAPDEGVGHFRRAAVLQARGALDLAAQDFESAVRLVPGDVPTRLAYGNLLMQRRELERALGHFEVAARLRPKDLAVRFDVARAHLALRRFDDVAADARELMKLGAVDDDLANAHSYMASALRGKSDFAGAAREFKIVLAMSGDHRIAHTLGLMQWHAGQLPQAIQTFRETVAWPDSNPYALLWLYIVQVQADPRKQAVAGAELSAQASVHQPHAWGDTLVELMLGNTSIEKALAEADAADSNELRAGRRCEADYYDAERLLMQGQVEPASGLLEEAYWVCPSEYDEALAVEQARRRIAARSRAK